MPFNPRIAAVALLLALSTGCTTEFAKQYRLAEAAPMQPNNPLIGAYEGTWHSRTGPQTGPIPLTGSAAHIVIDQPPDSTSLEIWTSLNNFWDLGTIEFDPANVHRVVQNSGFGTASQPAKANPPRFTAKIAAGLALVLSVDGRLNGDTLSMKYKIVDVGDTDVQHGQGTLTLHRITTHP